MTSIHKYILSALLLSAASVASADNFTGLGGEMNGMVWSLDGAVSGRFVGTGVVLSQGADIASFSAPSGIESVLTGRVSEISVYPNPVIDYLRVEGAADNACWSVVAIDGRLIAKGSLNDNTIDLSRIATGRYIVTIADPTGATHHSSIIIKK